jgi:hypothetical protein
MFGMHADGLCYRLIAGHVGLPKVMEIVRRTLADAEPAGGRGGQAYD